MRYIALAIIFLIAGFIIRYFVRNTFYWETIIKHLWKQIFQLSDRMASLLKGDDAVFREMARGYKKKIDFRGNLINAIIDYINSEDEDGSEEETFGYGRYDFDKISALAERDPDCFKELAKMKE